MKKIKVILDYQLAVQIGCALSGVPISQSRQLKYLDKLLKAIKKAEVDDV